MCIIYLTFTIYTHPTFRYITCSIGNICDKILLETPILDIGLIRKEVIYLKKFLMSLATISLIVVSALSNTTILADSQEVKGVSQSLIDYVKYTEQVDLFPKLI